MKWIIYIFTLGLSEVLTITYLHNYLGMLYLIVLYVATTVIGATLLLLQYPRFRLAFHKMNKLEKKFRNKLKDPEYKATSEEIETLKPMLYVSVYVMSAILVAVPGIITDFVGLFMVIPAVSSHLINRQITKTISHAETVQEP